MSGPGSIFAKLLTPAYWRPAYHSRNQLIDSGDRYTDCASLGIGLQPDVSDAVEGITGPRPRADNHACDDLKAAAIIRAGAVWSRSERYWNGYRAVQRAAGVDRIDLGA